ncbi:MAG: hypothetical protein PVF63_00145 [Gammaproteobacteria bacterium]
MQRIANLFSTAAILLVSANALGEPYEDEILRLDVPAGFDGPVAAAGGEDVEVVAFRWPRDTGNFPTLLQITKYENDAVLADMRDEERGAAAERYLLRFLEGVARRRSNFISSDPIRIRLAGLPAAKIFWGGSAQGRGLSGVTYCLVAGTTIISFQTQDFEPIPSELRNAIMHSIEALVLKDGP